MREGTISPLSADDYKTLYAKADDERFYLTEENDALRARLQKFEVALLESYAVRDRLLADNGKMIATLRIIGDGQLGSARHFARATLAKVGS